MQGFLQRKAEHEEDRHREMNAECHLTLEDTGLIHTILSVEQKQDERIRISVRHSVCRTFVHIQATDATGLRAALNTILRIIQTAEGVKEVIRHRSHFVQNRDHPILRRDAD